jgi:ethanolamine utilization protein EutA
MDVKKIELLSVGIDIGSSTSHLVFSKLLLIKDEKPGYQRYNIKRRDILYEGKIIDTPLLDDNTIDIDNLTVFLKEECETAGFDPADIQTGALIITGETAKKDNAPRIADTISREAGKFVAATAGPNFESFLAAMGSGAVARSKDTNRIILSCDIGGGTANMAISRNGEVLSTSCISIGGRLIKMGSEGKINGLSTPAIRIMEHVGLSYKVGDFISRDDLDKIAVKSAEILIEAMKGIPKSSLAKQLMVTDNLDFSYDIDECIFSGGVAEYIYGNGMQPCNDMGQILAAKILKLTPELKYKVVEPFNKIRATVIGAGSYSLSISGSSGYMDDKILFPLKNVPVIKVDVEESRLSREHVLSKVNAAFQRYDLVEGSEIVALFFKDPVRVNYPDLELFAKSIEAALLNSVDRKIPVILIFEKDIACSVGNVIRRETNLKNNLLSLDELSLNNGDWIDISEPLVGGQVFPVTVKSLVFPSTNN